MRWFKAAFVVILSLWSLPGLSQETDPADRSFLTAFLEDSLSGAGRAVRIEGFVGALSSRATFTTMTIADDAGVWITIRNGALSWNRSALLSGRVEINELTADAILIDRLPARAGSGGSSWSARSGFTLPELPVSVTIGKLGIGSVRLATPVLSENVTLSVKGAVSLAGGEGEATLDVDRIDGREGRITFRGGFSNATRMVSVDLLANEGEGGIAAKLLAVPGLPALQLAVSGNGPLERLALDLSLSSQGRKRVSGRISLSSPMDENARQQFSLELSGSVAPLFLPAYQAFFGDAVQLRAAGSRAADGAITLDNLSLSTTALTLNGALNLSPDYLPDRAALTLNLGTDGIDPVLLPLPGTATHIREATLNIGFDRAVGPDWSIGGKVSGLSRQGFSITTLALDGSGRFVSSAGNATGDRLDGGLTFVAGGIAVDDPALAMAIGPFLTGKTVVKWQTGAPFSMSGISVMGQGYAAKGDLSFSTADRGLEIAGKVVGDFRDLSRLSGLAGTSVSGAGQVEIDGRYAPLSGSFDAIAAVTGDDVAVGTKLIDRFVAGRSRIDIAASRDMDGLTIRSLAISARGLTATASGHINDDKADLSAEASLPDLSMLGSGLAGAIQGKAVISGKPDNLMLVADGRAEDLAVGNVSADRILSGPSTLHVEAGISGTGISIGKVDIANRSLSLQIAGRGGGLLQPLSVTGRLADIAILTPDFSGPLGIGGTVTPRSGGYDLQLSATGPGNTRAEVSGRTNGYFSQVDLRAAGSLQSAVINPFLGPATIGGPADFDLRMTGRPVLANLSGTLGLRGVQVSVPQYAVSVTGISGTARLTAGQAEISASGAVRGGGTIAISGSVGLASPRPVDIAIRLSGAHFRDPQLFETTVDGSLRLSGPLAGGAIVSGQLALGDTEIRLAATSFSGSAFSAEVRHIADSQPVRATRRRAGLDGQDGAGSRGTSVRPVLLDLDIIAKRRVYVRGRGLDAELGGQVHVSGSSAAVQPSGQFTLVRGRLDLLGKRFDITEGLVRLEGALVPTIRFVATTVTDTTAASIIIAGPASEPVVSFSSQPPLPQEEVVAQLLFGRGLTGLSPFQAAQLASAVATLTGRGGEGVIGRLRTSFGLDDLDVAAAEDGTLAIRAGKYLTSNIYTDVTVGQDGKSVVRLNLDLSRSVTARGRISTDGSTGIGIYYDRDY